MRITCRIRWADCVHNYCTTLRYLNISKAESFKVYTGEVLLTMVFYMEFMGYNLLFIVSLVSITLGRMGGGQNEV